jgi:hypothetical protein
MGSVLDKEKNNKRDVVTVDAFWIDDQSYWTL